MTRLLSLIALLASTAAAQVWEQIPPPPSYGNPIDLVTELAFLPGERAEGSLLMVGGRMMVYDPDGATDDQLYPWVDLSKPGFGPSYVSVTTSGTALATGRTGSRVLRSTDRGSTWVHVEGAHGNSPFFQSTLPSLVGPDGRSAVFSSTGSTAIRSFGDGAEGTWETLFTVGGDVVGFSELPPSPDLPEGRLLAGVYNGITTSDDGGRTWQPGTGAYGFAQFVAYSFAFMPQAGHPYGGSVLAGVNDLEFGGGRDSSATIYRSDDGGTNWTRAYRFSPSALGIPNASQVVLTATPDGVVWAGVSYAVGPPTAGESAIAKSLDGGQTWEPAGYVGWEVNQLVLGPEGRLYAATPDGVWRTTAPAYAVAGEDGPATPASIGVRVWPNPTGGPVTIELTQATPGEVTVTLLDTQGRVVQEIHRGGARDGQRFSVETAGLAPGAYVVRVTTAGGTATAGLAVAR